VLVADSAPVDWLPLVVFDPDHAPLALQEVAFVEDQVRLEAEPLSTVEGLAVRLTVGAGVAATVTVADFVSVPPAPVQAKV